MSALIPLYEVGVVIGKFMPLQKGHVFLLRFAKQYCKQLIVVVDCLEGQTSSAEYRKACVEQQCPANVRVVALTSPMPQEPGDNPQFWKIWCEAIFNAVGTQPDVLVAAMDYGWPLAQALECEFVALDIARESFPISATEIRNNPMKNWDYLAESARGEFAKKVCLMGPESTGKSTSVMQAARELDTVFVSEYAKAVIDRQAGQFFEHNVKDVAIAQYRSEQALLQSSNRVLLCDTNVLTTAIWSDILFGKHPAELDTLIEHSRYDLTLLMSPDVPWVSDSHRQVLPDAAADEVRWRFFHLCQEWLERLGWPYAVINGPLEGRTDQVVLYCKELTQG